MQQINEAVRKMGKKPVALNPASAMTPPVTPIAKTIEEKRVCAEAVQPPPFPACAPSIPISTIIPTVFLTRSYGRPAFLRLIQAADFTTPDTAVLKAEQRRALFSDDEVVKAVE